MHNVAANGMEERRGGACPTGSAEGLCPSAGGEGVSPRRTGRVSGKDYVRQAHWFADTRPLPGRPRVRYAGCMTAHPAPPINHAYGSQPQPVCPLSLWERVGVRVAPAQTFENIGTLALLTREAGHGLGNAHIKDAKSAKRGGRFTRETPVKSARFRWPLASLSKAASEAAIRASGRDGLPLPTAARRAPTALALSGGGR